MVKSLVGMVSGDQIVFHPDGEGWKAEIPANIYGEFVIELFAEDDAGNSSYYNTILFVAKLNGIYVQILNENFSEKGLTRFLVMQKESNYQIRKEGTMRFMLGEEKYVDIRIISKENKEFTILEAKYELYESGILEKAGECEIEKDIVHSLIKPIKISRNYELVVTYRIAGETFKEKVEIKVEA